MTSAAGCILIVYGPEDGDEAARVASYYERMEIRTRLANGEGDADAQAVADSRGIVVLVSHAALRAATVREATDRAADLGKPIFPVRLSNLSANGGLPALPPEGEWTNAFGPDAQANIAALGARLRAAVRAPESAASPFAAAPPSPFEQAGPSPFDAPPPPMSDAPASGAYDAGHHPYAHDGRPAYPPPPYQEPDYAQSRKVRPWIFWVAGGIAALVILSIAIPWISWEIDRSRYATPIETVPVGGQPGGSSTSNPADQFRLVGRWCANDNSGSYSRFDSGGVWVNYNPQEGALNGTWQATEPDGLVLSRGGATSRLRYVVSQSSLTLIEPGKSPFTLSRCS